jgi:hypothetical protein
LSSSNRLCSDGDEHTHPPARRGVEKHSSPSPPNWRAGHLHAAPTEAALLTAEIAGICQQIDRRLGNPPGTAEGGLYFWLAPPGGQSAEVLTRLHADAAEFLHNLTHPTKGTPHD